jgi:hypothetical protein
VLVALVAAVPPARRHRAPPPSRARPHNTSLAIATATFTVVSIGGVLASWDSSAFDFFGAAPGPAICMTCPIPEPFTGGSASASRASPPRADGACSPPAR